MLEILRKVFRRNSTSKAKDLQLDFIPFEDTEEWKNIKAYDRSNSETKQLYYKGSYLCSCSSEEIDEYKTYIVDLLLDGVEIDTIKELLRSC